MSQHDLQEENLTCKIIRKLIFSDKYMFEAGIIILHKINGMEENKT